MKNHSDMEEIKLMKGNEVVAEAAVRCGCDGYFGYPITPQSEVLETLMEMRPWETSGMTVIQAESEVAAINMVYGGAATGKRVMTSSSSPGISLMCEGLSYLAGAELPCVVVNVSRGGPGLGTIQPSQADYFQAVKGGGHGDYHLIVLAPYSVQEMYDFVPLGFDLAFKYRNPVMILSDGVIGQMMEKVVLSPARPRWTDDRIARAVRRVGRHGQAVFARAEHRYVRRARLARTGAFQSETESQVRCDPPRRGSLRADALRRCRLRARGLRVFGRIALKVVEMARADGHRVGLLRPITLFPFPTEAIDGLSRRVKGFLSVEMSTGQMVEDVMLASRFRVPVRHYGRTGGVVHSPGEVYDALKSNFSLQ